MAGILLPDGLIQLGSNVILFPGGVVQVTEATSVTITCSPTAIEWQTTSGEILEISIINCVPIPVEWQTTRCDIIQPVIETDTPQVLGGGGRGKRQKFPYYDGYEESRDILERVVAKDKPVQKKPVVQERTETKPEQSIALSELVAKAELPTQTIEVVVDDESDIETAVVMLLLAA